MTPERADRALMGPPQVGDLVIISGMQHKVIQRHDDSFTAASTCTRGRWTLPDFCTNWDYA